MNDPLKSTQSIPSLSFSVAAEEDGTEVKLQHFRGGYLAVNRRLTTNRPTHHPNVGATFLILPIKQTRDNDEQNLATVPTFDTEIEEMVEDELHSIASHVAIAHRQSDGTWQYLSCGSDLGAYTETTIAATTGRTIAIRGYTGRTIATFQSSTHNDGRVGRSETFNVVHDYATSTCSFQSCHTGLFLYRSSTHGGVAFKTKTSDSSKWRIEVTNPSTLSILYLGVVRLNQGNGGFRVLTETIAPESFDPAQIHDVLSKVTEMWNNSTRQGFVSFLHFHTSMWCVKVDQDAVCCIMAAKEDFPKAVAVDCVDDLHVTYKRHFKGHYDNSDHQAAATTIAPDEKTRQRHAKELYFLRMDYEETSLKAWNNLTEPVRAQMQENIECLLQNIDSAQDMLDKATQLQEQAAVFRKNTAQLRQKYSSRRILLFGLLVGSAAGATVGWLMGGPLGAAYLGSQMVEIAVGTGIGCLSTPLFHYTYKKSENFWTYKVLPWSFLTNTREMT